MDESGCVSEGLVRVIYGKTRVIGKETGVYDE